MLVDTDVLVGSQNETVTLTDWKSRVDQQSHTITKTKTKTIPDSTPYHVFLPLSWLFAISGPHSLYYSQTV